MKYSDIDKDALIRFLNVHTHTCESCGNFFIQETDDTICLPCKLEMEKPPFGWDECRGCGNVFPPGTVNDYPGYCPDCQDTYDRFGM